MGKKYFVFNDHANQREGAGGWVRFENVAFDTARQAADWAKNMAESGKHEGRLFRLVEVPADKAAGLLDQIRQTKGATFGPLHVGQYLNKLDDVPLVGFFGKKLKMAAAVVGTVGGTVLASGTAFAETGSARQAASAGYEAGKEQLGDTFNPKGRFTRAFNDVAHGRIGAGVARTLEGAADVVGLGGIHKSLGGDAAERSRVEPVAERIFRERGARGVMLEVMRTHEDPKYILLANNTLPETYRGKPMDVAMKDDRNFRTYEHALNERIEHSSGAQKQMWQGQLETIYGYRHAIKIEDGIPAPRPAAALGLNF